MRRHLRFWPVLLLSIAAVVWVVSGCPSQSPVDETGAVYQYPDLHAVMKATDSAFGAMAGNHEKMASDPAAAAAVKTNAGHLALLMTQARERFSKGADFDGWAQQAAQAAGQIVTHLDAGEAEWSKIPPQIGAIGKACGDCHGKYR